MKLIILSKKISNDCLEEIIRTDDKSLIKDIKKELHKNGVPFKISYTYLEEQLHHYKVSIKNLEDGIEYRVGINLIKSLENTNLENELYYFIKPCKYCIKIYLQAISEIEA